MKERPIIFSAPMVRALLEGRKTQTRRVIKPQPEPVYGDDGELLAHRFPGNVGVPTCLRDINKSILVQHHTLTECPYGVPGDRLWVRETWCAVDDRDYDGELWIDYKATPRYAESHPAGWENAPNDPGALKWKSPLFMPRWASRITLEIVGVRIERLFDISEEDAEAEGVSIEETRTLTYRGAFAITWDRINKKRGYGWEGGTNPWVWALTFRKVTDAKHNDDRAS